MSAYSNFITALSSESYAAYTRKDVNDGPASRHVQKQIDNLIILILA